MAQSDTPVTKSPTALHDDSHRQQVRIRQQQRQQQEQQRLKELEKLPTIKCDPKILEDFIQKVDCSDALDFYSHTRVVGIRVYQNITR